MIRVTEESEVLMNAETGVCQPAWPKAHDPNRSERGAEYEQEYNSRDEEAQADCCFSFIQHSKSFSNHTAIKIT